MSYPQADMNNSCTTLDNIAMLKRDEIKRTRNASGIRYTEDEIIAYHEQCERDARGA
jgi:hypothetical protein